ncbi:5-oxoprolinase subunit PxpB [Kangiella sp. HD9-110m-PIT-SAG07]|nr:5-oxoprolinase subunit PxpB [Kangiella sp. HD9-110m-PIT-SAG07]
MMANFSIHTNSDNSVIVEFSDDISIELTRYILSAKEIVERNRISGFIQAVPAYNSLLVIIEPSRFSASRVIEKLETLLRNIEPLSLKHSKKHIVPVCYHTSLAPDLEQVAKHNGLTAEEVIEVHTRGEYPVYMLGFLPGFLYLGGLDTTIHSPRRNDPRPKVEAGSVGIGGDQTGIYPIDSPGGWNIIGKTPIPLLDITRKDHPAIAKPLDTIQFKAISLEEFKQYEH